MEQTIKKAVGFLLALAFILTGIPFTNAQAAAKPVISSSQVTVKNNSCTIIKGQKKKLTARYGKKNITQKGNWKSSKKAVATVSKKGVLTARKAGKTNVTIKYKGKTSKKLKVVVVGQQPAKPSEPTSPSDPVTEPDQPSIAGSYMITYNKNSKNKSDKLDGSATQSVSGEILKFDTTVTAGSGRKFIGWFTEKDGGQRVYETYKPAGDMTLYAHYTDENVQRVTFVLGCDYGNTYSFMTQSRGVAVHYRDYDWLNKRDNCGPLDYYDDENVKWEHSYAVSDKGTFSVDDMPVPSVPGYTFAGWYTKEQSRSVSASTSAERIAEGSDVDTDTTILYARFTKKLTISFDDLRLSLIHI